jgi:hypothetical protein
VTWSSWKTILPERLSGSFQRWANDARSWFFLLFAVWIYAVAPSAVGLIRGVASLNALRGQVHKLRYDFDRFLMPRTLDDKQTAAIARYLKQYDPQEIGIRTARHDSEAMRLAGDFIAALRNGNWLDESGIQVDDAPEGVTICAPSEGPTTLESLKHPNAATILSHAFDEANIPYTGGACGPNTPEHVTILVGPRPSELSGRELNLVH